LFHKLELLYFYSIKVSLYFFPRNLCNNSKHLLFLQGARVYPTIIGRSNYGIDETRRVTQVAAVLEGLDLAVRKTDKLGGIVWNGKDLLTQWYDDQCEKYFYETEVLKKPKLVLDRIELTADQLELAVEDAERSVASLTTKPTISIEGLSEEQVRSVQNQKIVCKCGHSKKMEVDKDGVKYSRVSVWTGFKKRTRCKKCPGCLAIKCGECKNCTQKHLKKPCVLKVCQFPVTPKCPCFA
jgi:hypothetical protein